LISWAFDNWERIKSKLKIRSMTPQFSLFCSAYMNDLLAMKDLGPTVSEKNRYVEDSSPKVGW